MWEKTLIESRGPNRARKWWMFPLSLFIHSLIIGVIVGASYWFVEAVQPPAIPVTLYSAPPPPPPPPPAARKAKAPEEPKPKPVEEPKHEVQPKIVPDEVQQPTPEEPETPAVEEPASSNEDTSSSGGEEGGIEGGVEGGVQGGVIGGTPGGVIGGQLGGVIGGTTTGEETPIHITAEVTKPELIHRVEPDYPEIARKAHIQGVVILEAVITTSGSVEEVKVLKSIQPTLDQSAMNAVKQWKYKPAILNGKPVKVYFTVTVTFTLH